MKKTKKEGFNIDKFVLGYKTKHAQGFTDSELKAIKEEFPFEFNEDKFNNALMGITCMVIDDESVVYHCDIITAFYCGVENRGMKWYEWD